MTLDQTGPASEPNRPEPCGRWSELWVRWVLTVTGAEALGFVVPGVVGAVLAHADWSVLVPAIAAAGLVEGALLGAGQAHVLRRALPGLRRSRFVMATAVAAGVAYLISMIPVLLGERLSTLTWPLAAGLGIAVGVAVVSSIGVAQWMVLRAELPGSVIWIPASAAPWLLGLLAFLAVTSPLWRPGEPMGVVIAIGILGELVMAVVVAVVTGVAIVHLLARAAGG